MRISSGPLAAGRPDGRTGRYGGSTGVSNAFGTFGELMQGCLPGRHGDFLVTLPIARWTTATYRTRPGSGEVVVFPPHKWKARRLTEMVLESAGVRDGGELTIDSNLPEGKGLASSSADLFATVRAVANALDLRIPPDSIERFLGRLEPTDGVLYPGIVAFDHRRVRLRARLGSLPTMTIVGVDEGGTVDTMEFNRIPKPFSAADRREYARLLERLTTAVPAGDLAAVGEVATRSAELNQALCPKRTLEAVLGVCRDAGGLGVVTAHSGTMLGILLDPTDPRYADQVTTVLRDCAELTGDASLFRTLTFD